MFWPVLAVLLAAASPSPQRPLRICADPDNLPFSNQRREGFENRIAELLGRELHAEVSYAWWSQGRGFVRKSQGAGACEVYMGVPAGLGSLLRTAPYYRSSYVFVTRHDRGLRLHSLDDSSLRRLRIGVQVIADDGADTPPAAALARRGLGANLVAFAIPEERAAGRLPGIIAAVARGKVDVAVAWGPLAGYWAQRAPVRLDLVAVQAPDDLRFLPFSFAIAVGVRRSDSALRARLDSALLRRRVEIERILDAYGVPRVSEDVR